MVSQIACLREASTMGLDEMFLSQRVVSLRRPVFARLLVVVKELDGMLEMFFVLWVRDQVLGHAARVYSR
jgi:hypothetical protein